MEAWRVGLPGVADEEVRRIVEHSTVRGDDGKLRGKIDPMMLKTHGLLESPGGESDASDLMAFVQGILIEFLSKAFAEVFR